MDVYGQVGRLTKRARLSTSTKLPNDLLLLIAGMAHKMDIKERRHAVEKRVAWSLASLLRGLESMARCQRTDEIMLATCYSNTLRYWFECTAAQYLAKGLHINGDV